MSIRPVSSEASHPSCDDLLLDDLLLDRLDDLSFLPEPLLLLRLEELLPLVLLFFREPSLREPDPDDPVDLGLLLRLLPVLLPLFLLDDLDDAGLSDFLSRSVRPSVLRADATPMAFWPGLTDRARRLPNLPSPLARSLPRARAGDLDRDMDRFFFGFSGGRTRSRERARPVDAYRCRNIGAAGAGTRLPL